MQAQSDLQDYKDYISIVYYAERVHSTYYEQF